MTTTSVAEIQHVLEGSMRGRIRNTSKAGLLCWLFAAGIFMAMAVTSPLAAQTTRGTITGLVVDTSGAVVPGATVTITETATNVITRAKSEPDGMFLMAGVLPGSYSLRVEAGGFKALVKTNLNLSAGERLDIGQLQLEVGSEKQTLSCHHSRRRGAAGYQLARRRCDH